MHADAQDWSISAEDSIPTIPTICAGEEQQSTMHRMQAHLAEWHGTASPQSGHQAVLGSASSCYGLKLELSALRSMECGINYLMDKMRETVCNSQDLILSTWITIHLLGRCYTAHCRGAGET